LSNFALAGEALKIRVIPASEEEPSPQRVLVPPDDIDYVVLDRPDPALVGLLEQRAAEKVYDEVLPKGDDARIHWRIWRMNRASPQAGR
jgi:hypothetical protein